MGVGRRIWRKISTPRLDWAIPVSILSHMIATADGHAAPFTLAFIADAVPRRGGQERAAAGVLTPVAPRVPVTVTAVPPVVKP